MVTGGAVVLFSCALCPSATVATRFSTCVSSAGFGGAAAAALPPAAAAAEVAAVAAAATLLSDETSSVAVLVLMLAAAPLTAATADTADDCAAALSWAGTAARARGPQGDSRPHSCTSACMPACEHAPVSDESATAVAAADACVAGPLLAAAATMLSRLARCAVT